MQREQPVWARYNLTEDTDLGIRMTQPGCEAAGELYHLGGGPRLAGQLGGRRRSSPFPLTPGAKSVRRAKNAMSD